MKKLLFLFIATFFLFSFAEKNTLKKNYAEFELAGKTLMISKYEVSNGEYYDFLNEIKHDGKKLTIARVYSENWQTDLETPSPFEDYYFGHESYKNYPLVNVSYQGAEMYCEWLSEKLSKENNLKIIARLPTQEEWLYAAKGGDENSIYGWTGTEIVNKDGYLYGNFKKDDEESNTIMAPVDAYQPNKLGLYNCSGNVAEMIQTNNVSMGGSWKTNQADIALSKSANDYSKANTYTGFRVILEIEKH